MGDQEFQDMDLEEIQEPIDTRGIKENNLMEMSASEPVPGNEEEDVEEVVPENKLTLNNLTEGFQLFKTISDFLYDMDLSMIQALKLKQIVEEDYIEF